MNSRIDAYIMIASKFVFGKVCILNCTVCNQLVNQFFQWIDFKYDLCEI